MVAIALLALSFALQGSAQDAARIVVVDHRGPEDLKSHRDSNFSAFAFLPDKAVKPSAVDQLKAAISSRTTADTSIDLMEFSVIDYFPTRLKSVLRAGEDGPLRKFFAEYLVNTRTDWSFVSKIGISDQKDSVICLLSGTFNGKQIAVAAHEPYQLSAFTGLVRSNKHFKAAVSTCIDRLAQQAVDQMTSVPKPPGN